MIIKFSREDSFAFRIAIFEFAPPLGILYRLPFVPCMTSPRQAMIFVFDIWYAPFQ